MRRPKASLFWYDTSGVPHDSPPTLAEHLCAILHGVCREVFLVGDLAVEVDGVPRLLDAVPGVGPLGGLLTVLQQPGEDWRIVLSCDTPFVNSGLLAALLALAGATEGSGCEAVLPQTPDGQLHPLCAAYHSKLADRLHSLVPARASGAGTSAHPRAPSVHRFVESLDTRILKVEDTGLLRNLNTMREYLAAINSLDVADGSA
ncbi:MAG: NTP transferase domain-containing protein [Bryobacterales bacterium]|nr:NTP transferase domain-containing protein [Bryobacterales bacterium]